MAEEKIGIKVADGTFYPILDADEFKKKRLVLTTVNDDQENVQIDLYRGKGEQLENPAYVGSLMVENITRGKSGETEIEMVVGVDEEGNLETTAEDKSAGTKQSLSVSLENLDQGGQYEVPDFSLEDEDLSEDFVEDIDWDSEEETEEAPAEETPVEEELAEEALPSFEEEFPGVEEAPAEESAELSLDEDVFGEEEITEESAFEESASEAGAPEEDASEEGGAEEAGLEEGEAESFDFGEEELGFEEQTAFGTEEFGTEELGTEEFGPEPEDFGEEFGPEPEAEEGFEPEPFEEEAFPETAEPGAEEEEEEDQDRSRSRPVLVGILVILALALIGALLYLFVFMSKTEETVPPLEAQNAPIEESEGEATAVEKQEESEDASEDAVAASEAQPEEPAAAQEDASGQAGESAEVAEEEPEARVAEEGAESAPAPVEPGERENWENGVWYRIRWGDTLWGISRSFYDTPWSFNEIADENNINNPDRIFAEEQIFIPKPKSE